MPRRDDIQSILIIGAGPIVIGQACEFDYSGVQACRALREEGYRVILVNSNPATIMTDPDSADVVYIEPVEWQTVAEIIAKERPDAILPTMGGQTALNCAQDLAKHGVLARYGVEVLGATTESIDKAEDRELFKLAMEKIGLEMPKAVFCHSLDEVMGAAEVVGYPAIVRPAFTLGGSGGGIARNAYELREIGQRGLEASPIGQVLIEESILGWKELEMEVVRDHEGSCLIVCSIENFDAMGVHTGDSIAVAPAMTLTESEYAYIREKTFDVMREIGVEGGGANVQFALNPEDGRLIVVEMNPRVSRSSALASKATGYPIAKISAKLAVGYRLSELDNPFVPGVSAAAEPSIDYVVVKCPRFAFEKFRGVGARLGTQMKAVGEVMAMGRSFREALGKALRGLETGVAGLESLPQAIAMDDAALAFELENPGPERIFYMAEALRRAHDGALWSVERVAQLTGVDPFFVRELAALITMEEALGHRALESLDRESLLQYKQAGFSDRQLSQHLRTTEAEVRAHRHALGLRPVYHRVDTSSGRHRATHAYLYSSYGTGCEAAPTEAKKIMILGAGPNRIGQGIEFDYCCVHAAYALREAGYETLMVNCNPETVSTDYDTSDRLYFEPITLEDVLEIVAVEKPSGLILQLGGQTPLKLARGLEQAGVPILGTSPDAIDLAEDRKRFQALIDELGLKQPAHTTVTTFEEARQHAAKVGFPLMVRPSYVLGGRAMAIARDAQELEGVLEDAFQASRAQPVLLDRYLQDAIELDLDALADGHDVVVVGIMEHIEQAGVHSGDSACALPPHSVSEEIQETLRHQATLLAKALGVVGLMNIQFAIAQGEIYVLEVNPRASRTVPFVAKATGLPVAKWAALVMAGHRLADLGLVESPRPAMISVKEAVLPFRKFPGVDVVLGPEMKSTGETMGSGATFPEAYAKALLGAGVALPTEGRVLVRVAPEAAPVLKGLVQSLQGMGFAVQAGEVTAAALQAHGVEVARVTPQDRLEGVNLVLASGPGAERLRKEAYGRRITQYTTVAGFEAGVAAIARLREGRLGVVNLSAVHGGT